jgi:hypothetical protein
MNRVLRLLVAPACLFAVQPTWAQQPDFRLQVVPAIVYKVDDPGNLNTSSFVFNIAVICSTDCELTRYPPAWNSRVPDLSSRARIGRLKCWQRSNR